MGYKCKICNSELEYFGEYYKCPCCGAVWSTSSVENPSPTNLSAWAKFRARSFWDAKRDFEEELKANAGDYEASWGVALSNAEIIYIVDRLGYNKYPISSNIDQRNEELWRENVRKVKALAKDCSQNLRYYDEQEHKVNNFLTEAISDSKNQIDYDVFISYKESGKLSDGAKELAEKLRADGYKVFYGGDSLKHTTGSLYSVGIYTAIEKAKAFIIYMESKEQFESTWVQEEYGCFDRYIRRGQKDKRSLFVVYDKMSPSDLPSNFENDECIRYDDGAEYDRIKSHVQQIIDKSKQEKEFEFEETENGLVLRKYNGMLKTVEIPAMQDDDPVIGIRVEAFLFKEIEKVKIPAFVEEFASALSGIVTLQKITVARFNCRYKDIDGVLFDKTAETLVCYPSSRENQYYEIPKSVKHIEKNAFGICEYLKGIKIPYGMTEIDEEAFSCFTNLEMIEIPESIVKIGRSAFNRCINLTEIKIPHGVTEIEDFTFCDCIRLERVELGRGITRIGASAFSNCAKLTTPVLPDGLTEIGGYAFAGCDSLRYYRRGGGRFLGNEKNPELALISVDRDLCEITVSENTKCICADAFAGSEVKHISVKAGNTRYYAKNNCVIDKVSGTLVAGCSGSVIPNDGSVKAIGDFSFLKCKNLDGINIVESITKIGRYAFYDCKNLANVTIAGSVKEIEEFAFACCDGLEQILIPDSVEVVGVFAFEKCKSLKTVKIGNSVKRIGESAFSGCDSLENVQVPDSVEDIEYAAFFDCKSLKSVKIGNSVKRIGHSAFFGCDSLEIALIPDSVETVDAFAFEDCKELTSVRLGRAVRSVSERAFANCERLISVVITSGDVDIDEDAFNGCANSSIYCEFEKTPDSFVGELYVEDVLSRMEKFFLKIENDLQEDLQCCEEAIPVYYKGEWEYVDGLPTPIKKD